MKPTPERLSLLEEAVRQRSFGLLRQAQEGFEQRLMCILTPAELKAAETAMRKAKGDPDAIPGVILAIIQADPEADRLRVQVRYLLPLGRNFLRRVAEGMDSRPKEGENEGDF